MSFNKGLAKNWAEKKNPAQAKVNDYGIVLNNVEDGLSFGDVASKIQYKKFKDNQFAFCSTKALNLLKWVGCHDC